MVCVTVHAVGPYLLPMCWCVCLFVCALFDLCVCSVRFFLWPLSVPFVSLSCCSGGPFVPVDFDSTGNNQVKRGHANQTPKRETRQQEEKRE